MEWIYNYPYYLYYYRTITWCTSSKNLPWFRRVVLWRSFIVHTSGNRVTRETHQNEKRSSYTQHILSFCYHALVLVVVVAMDRFTCLGMDLLVVVKQVDYMRRSVGRLAPPFSTKKRRMSFVILHRNVNMCVECKSHDVYFRLLSNMNCHLK